MAEIINIPPNFGIKKFSTETEAREFLERFCFVVIIRRPTRDVWETTKEPKRRAILYKNKTGLYIAALLTSGHKLKSIRRRQVKREHSARGHFNERIRHE
jgi:hypothetical protein